MKHLILILALAIYSNFSFGGAADCASDSELGYEWLDAGGGTVAFNNRGCTFLESGAKNGYASHGNYVIMTALTGDTGHKTGAFEMNLQGATNDQGPANAYYRCTADWRRSDKTVGELQNRTYQVTHTITEEDPKDPKKTISREVTETVTEQVTVQKKVGNLYTLSLRCNGDAVVQDLTREDTDTKQIAAR